MRTWALCSRRTSFSRSSVPQMWLPGRNRNRNRPSFYLGESVCERRLVVELASLQSGRLAPFCGVGIRFGVGLTILRVLSDSFKSKTPIYSGTW